MARCRELRWSVHVRYRPAHAGPARGSVRAVPVRPWRTEHRRTWWRTRVDGLRGRIGRGRALDTLVEHLGRGQEVPRRRAGLAQQAVRRRRPHGETETDEGPDEDGRHDKQRTADTAAQDGPSEADGPARRTGARRAGRGPGSWVCGRAATRQRSRPTSRRRASRPGGARSGPRTRSAGRSLRHDPLRPSPNRSDRVREPAGARTTTPT